MADTFERVMVIVAHPDDAESWVGGTVAKLAREGETVSYVIVTNGDKGSADRSMSPARARQDPRRGTARAGGDSRCAARGVPRLPGRRRGGHAGSVA